MPWFQSAASLPAINNANLDNEVTRSKNVKEVELVIQFHKSRKSMRMKKTLTRKQWRY